MKKQLSILFLLLISQVLIAWSPPPPITAAFSASPNSSCGIPLTTFFTDQSIDPDTWLWEFGDGGTSTAQNPVHNYLTAGVFIVKLTIQDTIFGTIDITYDTVKVCNISDVANAGLDELICDTLTNLKVLQGNPPLFGDGNWSSLGSASITFPSIPTVVAMGLVPGNNLFVWSISSACCPTTSDTVNIIIGDTLPLITCPGNKNVKFDNNCQFVLPDYTDSATTSNNCIFTPVVTQIPAIGTIITTTQTIKLIAINIYGYTDSCYFDVIPTDTTAPIITCPANQSVGFDNNCQFTLPDYTALAITSDNCSSIITVTQSPVIGTVITTTQTITLIADDGNGNLDSCSFNVIPTDTIAPVISCPVNQNVGFDNNCQFTLPDYTSSITTSDNCSTTITLTQSPVIGTVITTTQTITLIADDGNGNLDSCSFNVIPTDTIAPVISCPANQNVGFDNNCQFILPDYTALATTSDNCSSIITVTQNPAIGSIITTNQTITLIANDGNGNLDSCSFDVIPTDTTNPVITCPINQNVGFDASCQFTLLDYTGLVTASDNCSSTITVAQNPVVGTIITTTQTITLIANDGNGNLDSCSFDVIPSDIIAPTITCFGNQNVGFDNNCQFILLDYTSLATTSDNCSSTITVTQNPIVGTVITTTQTITLIANDGNGNIDSCTFDVIPADTITPVITCLGNISSCSSSVTYAMPTATDNCGAATITQIVGLASGSNFPVGITTNTFVAIDNAGNSDTCSFDVEIYAKPVISQTTINVRCNGASNGSVDATITNGTTPYVYNWSNGVITEDVTGLSQGIYTLVVNDFNTCSDTLEIVITEPLPLNISETIINISCFGLNDGAITSNISGGTQPYVYNWSNAITTPNINGLATGNYSLTITDSNNCTLNGNYTIIEPEKLIVDTVLSQFGNYHISTLGACDGAIDLIVSGGMSPYLFNWDNGEAIEDLFDLCAGIYFVEVVDINNCITTVLITLTEPNDIKIPEGFSPNGDGINDIFIIEGIDIFPESELIIFNRWGNKTYQAAPYNNDWDGSSEKTIIGNKVPDGSYFYKLKLDNENIRTGYLIIKR